MAAREVTTSGTVARRGFARKGLQARHCCRPSPPTRQAALGLSQPARRHVRCAARTRYPARWGCWPLLARPDGRTELGRTWRGGLWPHGLRVLRPIGTAVLPRRTRLEGLAPTPGPLPRARRRQLPAALSLPSAAATQAARTACNFMAPRAGAGSRAPLARTAPRPCARACAALPAGRGVPAGSAHPLTSELGWA